MKIHYFAWLREHTRCSVEEITLPEYVVSVRDLASYLVTRSPGHEMALRNLKTVRVAINQKYADIDSQISPLDEVAFFPPVTGG